MRLTVVAIDDRDAHGSRRITLSVILTVQWTSMRTIGIVAVGLLIQSAMAADAFAQRELRWDALDVRARLAEDGTLHVVERHSMRFSGDWNGGERRFSVRSGQEMQLTGVWRIDADTGNRIPLREGPLSGVDRFSWHDAQTLRWRSRLPSDPPFYDDLLIYDIAYTLANVVVRDAGGYVLHHDFAFPRRPGPIDRFTLQLELDPVWRGDNRFTNVTEGRLQPGESHIVRLPLQFAGKGKPSTGPWTESPLFFTALFILLIASSGLAAGMFIRHERAAGKFRSHDTRIDRPWLDRNILRYHPAVVGALWDEGVGVPELAAVMAQMTVDGKVVTKTLPDPVTGAPELEFKLTAAPSALSPVESVVVDALFAGQKSARISEIRAELRAVQAIADAEPFINDAISQAYKTVRSTAKRSAGAFPLLTLIGFGLIASQLISRMEMMFFFVVALVPILFLGSLARSAANRWKANPKGSGLNAVLLAAPLTGVFLFAMSLVMEPRTPAGLLGSTVTFLRGIPLAAAGYVILAIAVIGSALRAAATIGGSERLAVRRRLEAAREFFIQQLRSERPALEDRWYPYLIAFGLADHVDEWVRSFAPESSSSSWSSSGSHSGGGSAPAISRSWSGGGGAFGGAGATGAWGAATGSMLPTSSSGDSSSSSDGGSSSGGGGGGGW